MQTLKYRMEVASDGEKLGLWKDFQNSWHQKIAGFSVMSYQKVQFPASQVSEVLDFDNVTVINWVQCQGSRITWYSQA